MDIEIPGYDLEAELGAGAMATVYRARQRSLDRRVALKVLDPGLAVDEAFCQRFLHEGKALAQLRHPHVVAIHDSGHVGNRYYLAMEYVEGGTLKARIGAGMAPAEALGVLREIAGALGHAHACGLVHRDVKPENILYRADGSVVLADFGIVRTFDERTQLTAAGLAIGSPNYMSPEQARGAPLDGRSDLYSLGVLFHEMLTGAKPYRGADSLSTVLLHLNAPIPVLPPALARFQPLLDRLLAKAPEDRFPDAAALLAFDLDAAWAARQQQEAGGTIAVAIATTALPAVTDPDRPPAGKPQHTSSVPAHRQRTPRIAAALAAVLLVLGAGAWYLRDPGPEPAPGPPVAGTPPPPPALPVTPPPTPADTADTADTGPIAVASAAPAALLDRVYRQRHPGHEVTVSASPARARIGHDRMTLRLRSARAGYLYVLMAGTEHELLLLYPNATDDRNYVAADTDVQLPGSGWRLSAGGPPGTDHFLVVVSETPLDVAALGLERTGIYQRYPEAAVMRLTQQDANRPLPLLGNPRCSAAPVACPDRYGAARFEIEEIE